MLQIGYLPVCSKYDTEALMYPTLVTLFERALPGAHKDERNAYRRLKKRGDFKSFATPSGATTDFPDFGLRAVIDEVVIDLHFEYKQSRYAQMGSMRDWVFDGEKFTSPAEDEVKVLMLTAMNDSAETVANAKEMLVQFQTHCDPDITFIGGAMLNHITDMEERRAKLTTFGQAVPSFTIGNIKGQDLGEAMLSHYRSKFAPRKGADVSYLLMMIGDQVYVVDRNGPSIQADVRGKLCDMIGCSSLPVMQTPSAALEVRVQPIGLMTGRAKIDPMASFRLKSIAPGGRLID